MRTTPEQLDALMKRCRTGHARWDDLNDLLAECYGAIGGLRADLSTERQRAEAAEARVVEAERLLRELEFVHYADNWRYCPHPSCESREDTEHEPGCPVAAFLAVASPAAPPEPSDPLVQRVVDAARIWERFRSDPELSPAGVLREDSERDLVAAVRALRSSRKGKHDG